MAFLKRFEASALNGLIAAENGGNNGLIDGLIRTYGVGLEPTLRSISVAVLEENYEVLERLAHDLKSRSRALGLMAAASVCESIEREASHGGCNQGLITILQAEIPPALQELRRFEAERRSA